MRFITVLVIAAASSFVFSAPPLPWSSHPHSTQVASTMEEARALGQAEMKKYSYEVKQACASAKGHLSHSLVEGKCVDEGYGTVKCEYSRSMSCGTEWVRPDERREFWVETVDVTRLAYGRSIATRAAFQVLNQQILSLKTFCQTTGGEWDTREKFHGDTTGRREDGSYLATYSIHKYCSQKKSDGPQ